jgi:hypothetical protein
MVRRSAETVSFGSERTPTRDLEHNIAQVCASDAGSGYD